MHFKKVNTLLCFLCMSLILLIRFIVAGGQGVQFHILCPHGTWPRVGHPPGGGWTVSLKDAHDGIPGLVEVLFGSVLFQRRLFSESPLQVSQDLHKPQTESF